MKKIMFRGKDKTNQKWIYGNLEIPLLNQNASKHYIIGHSYSQYTKQEVIPNTVGQYTGIKDENGREIYGGDVLELYLNDYGEMEKPEKFIVNRDKKFFPDVCYLQQIEAHINKSDTNDYIKIIGDVYENPDLLTP